MPQPSSVFSLVENDLHLGRNRAAMMKLTSLSNEFSKNFHFLGLLAKTQKALLDNAGLIKTLSVTANLSKSSFAYLDLMYVLYSQGRLNEALDIALILQEKSLNLVQEKALVHCLIRIYLEFSDYEGLQEVITNYTASETDDLIFFARGLMSLASGEKDQALVLFRNAVELGPNNDQAWVSLAMLHNEMGDKELALANLEKAIDCNPKNATALKLTSQWYIRTSDETQKVMSKISYYLNEYEFDEEISLCYVQLLSENNQKMPALFEINKLIFNNPLNQEYPQLKKNLEDSLNI